MPPPLPSPTPEQAAAARVLGGARVLLLTGHERPDGDCIGSQAALARVLESRGQRVIVINADPPDPTFAELSEGLDFRVDDGAALPPHDVIVMLDGGDLTRTGALEGRLVASEARKVVVDHHLHDGEAWWDEAFVDVSASATGVLVRRIAAALDAPLDALAARALFTTLVTDTGWFKYSNTDVETLNIAAEAVGLGVRPAEIYGDLFQRQTPEHPRSLAAALARTTYYADGRLVLIDVPATDSGDAFEFDSDAALDVVRAVEVVEVAIVLRGIDGGRSKVSARSKGAFDVQRLCSGLGGGGHAKAAGATLDLDLDAAREAVVGRALAQFDETFERRAEPRTAADAAREEAHGR